MTPACLPCPFPRWFAGNQIRNVSAVGGNIVTGSPISDLNPIWMASGASFTALGQVRGGQPSVPAGARRHLQQAGHSISPGRLVHSSAALGGPMRERAGPSGWRWPHDEGASDRPACLRVLCVRAGHGRAHGARLGVLPWLPPGGPQAPRGALQGAPPSLPFPSFSLPFSFSFPISDLWSRFLPGRKGGAWNALAMRTARRPLDCRSRGAVPEAGDEERVVQTAAAA